MGQAIYKEYKTRPLECWAKGEELRRAHFRQTWQAREKGNVVVMGLFEQFESLPSGLGDFASPSYGPYFSGLMREPKRAVECLEVAEAKGYARETCCAMRIHLGQLFQGLSTRNPKGGTMTPDFVLQTDFCPHAAHTGRIVSEHLGIPYCCIDVPYLDTKVNRDYLLAQLMDSIEWMEKVTHRKYDDEKLVEAARNEWESMRLWAKVCILNRAVPAPLDARHLLALSRPGITMRHKKECVDFYQMLCDEVEVRVRDGISARGFEAARLLIEPDAPIFAPGFYKHPNEYGAVVIGGLALWVMTGVFQRSEDGHWETPKTLEERGIPIRTREDALRTLIELYLGHFSDVNGYNLKLRASECIQSAKDWHVDGIIFHYPRGCRVLDGWLPEAKWLAEAQGIRSTDIQGAHMDPRDWNEAEALKRCDTFLESLGLKKRNN